MKGKIDKTGSLYIERVGELRAQSCHFARALHDDFAIACGDECPLFGEPFGRYDSTINRYRTTITICQGRELEFSDFTDERRGKP